MDSLDYTYEVNTRMSDTVIDYKFTIIMTHRGIKHSCYARIKDDPRLYKGESYKSAPVAREACARKIFMANCARKEEWDSSDSDEGERLAVIGRRLNYSF